MTTDTFDTTPTDPRRSTAGEIEDQAEDVDASDDDLPNSVDDTPGGVPDDASGAAGSEGESAA